MFSGRRVASRPVKRLDTAQISADLVDLRAEVARLTATIEAHHMRLSPEQIGFLAAGAERVRVVRWLRAAGYGEAATAIEAGAHEPS